MDITHNFTVPPDEGARRLDVFLTGKLPGLTRSGIKNLLKDGRVFIGGKTAKPGLKVKPGDMVSVNVPRAVPGTLEGEDIPLDIIYEDDDVIIINKQAGLAVHPGAGRTSGTLVNALLFRGTRLSGIGAPLRPGIVHRLDKDTTGALAVAKNDFSHISLSKQFKEHTTGRKYLALVWGRVKDDEGSIDLPIGRDLKHRKKISPRTRKSRAAVTLYKVVKRYRHLTLLELSPKTGRTHQIRVHLSAINHPVAGDPTYGRKSMPYALSKPAADLLKKTKRQFLHARTLKITHPSKNIEMDFEAELPDDMREALCLLDAPSLSSLGVSER